mgnify:CR=1 FL=1
MYCSMIVILDGNSERVAHALRKIGLFGEEKKSILNGFGWTGLGLAEMLWPSSDMLGPRSGVAGLGQGVPRATWTRQGNPGFG